MFVLSGQLVAQNTVDFTEFKQRVLDNSNQLKGSIAERKALLEAMKLARTSFFPAIDAKSSVAGIVLSEPSVVMISCLISFLCMKRASLTSSRLLGKNFLNSFTVSHSVSQLNMMLFMSSRRTGLTMKVSDIDMLDALRNRSYASSSIVKNRRTDKMPSSYSTTPRLSSNPKMMWVFSYVG